MENKFCAGVVLYEPQAAHIENALALAACFGRVYAIDNTPGGIASEATARLRAAGIELLASGENIGLSRAYNVFARQASAAGFDYLAFYDQDSEPSEESIGLLQNYIISGGGDNASPSMRRRSLT